MTMQVSKDVSLPPPTELPTEREVEHPLDPAPGLAALRDQAPLCPLRYPDGHVGWLVLTHAAAREILGDSRFSVRYSQHRAPVGDPAGQAELGEAYESDQEAEGVLIVLDPPQHTRVRRAQAGFFTVKRVAELRQTMERIVADRLDAVEEAGQPCDLVEAFARPFSSLTLCAMLGVPPADRDQFEPVTVILDDPDASGAERSAALEAFFSYCRGVIRGKQDRPGADLLSELVENGELTEDEMVGAALQLFGAGHDTTAGMIALGTYALLSDRAGWEALCANPDQVDGAVDELLRYLTIVQRGAFTRTATEDVDFEGFRIEAGQSVTVSLAAANRDPQKFPQPDDLSLDRVTTGHVAFGHGRHMCIGQHFARLEMQVGFRALVKRFPTLELAVPAAQVPFRSVKEILYGVERLPVVW